MAYNPYDKSSVYQRRIKELETIIQEQKSRISELQNKYDEMFTPLTNRCYAHTGGLLCVFCGYKHECKHWNGCGNDADKGEEEQSDEGT